MFSCKRCGYSSSIRGNIRNHLKRKKPCKPTHLDVGVEILLSELREVNPIEPLLNPIEPLLNPNDKITHSCIFCKKSYSTNSHMRRHMRSCSEKIKADVNKDAIILSQKNQLEDQMKQMDEMKKEIGKLLDKVGNNNNNNNNNTITINCYGKENIDYITGEYLQYLAQIPYASIPKLIEAKHFHPKHPENHNVKITNRKQGYASVLINNKWELRDKKGVIDDMVDTGYNMIDSGCDVSILTDSHKSRYKAYQKKYDGDIDNTAKTIGKDVEILVLNNS